MLLLVEKVASSHGFRQFPTTEKLPAMFKVDPIQEEPCRSSEALCLPFILPASIFYVRRVRGDPEAKAAAQQTSNYGTKRARVPNELRPRGFELEPQPGDRRMSIQGQRWCLSCGDAVVSDLTQKTSCTSSVNGWVTLMGGSLSLTHTNTHTHVQMSHRWPWPKPPCWQRKSLME